VPELIPRFSIGQIVRLVSNPAVSGVVVEIDTSGAETLYCVFVDGAVRRYYEPQVDVTADREVRRTGAAAQRRPRRP